MSLILTTRRLEEETLAEVCRTGWVDQWSDVKEALLKKLDHVDPWPLNTLIHRISERPLQSCKM